MHTHDATRLVFLDESGFHVGLARRYGWAPPGQRPILVGTKRGTRLTLIGAIALDGVRAATMLKGTLNGDGFVRFLDEDLGPNLRPGDVVVMDGPPIHRVAGVAEALARHGATALYLPAYSPEFNPIEMCWSVMKAWVRKRAPRGVANLIDAIDEAWLEVTSTLCMSWVRHCGYAVGST